MKNKNLPVKNEADSLCLSTEQIINYSENLVIAADREVIERHLEQCALCTEALQGAFQIPGRQRKQNLINEIKANIRHKIRTPSTSHRSWKLVSVATGLLLLLTTSSIFYFYSQHPQKQDLADKFFTPYSNIVPITRGEQPLDDLQSAMQAYEFGRYDIALAGLKKVVANNSENFTAHFYAAICLIALKQPAPAIDHLKQLVAAENHAFQQPTLWYLALSHLKLNDIQKAKQILQQIVKQDGFYQKKSKELLSQLEIE